MPNLRKNDRTSEARLDAARYLHRARSRVLMAALLALLATWPALAAINEADLLPVDKAFALTTQSDGDHAVTLRWAIADGYYLYRQRTKVVGVSGTQVGSAVLPKGTPHDDEFFGKVETYRKTLAATVPVTTATAGQVQLKVSYQGCADLGVCYPPQSRMVTVSLASAGAAQAPRSPDGAKTNDPGFAKLGSTLGTALGARPNGLSADAPQVAGRDALPLPEQQAFAVDALASDGNTLLLRFSPARGYYLYRDKTSVSIEADGIAAGKLRWPPGKQHRDEHFGDVVVYFDEVEVPLPLVRTTTLARKATLTVGLQGCQDNGICYPPMTRTLSVSIPTGKLGSASADGSPAANKTSSIDQTTSREVLPADEASTGDSTDAGDADAAPVSANANPTPAADGSEAAASQKDAAIATASAATDTDLAEDSRLAASLTGPGRWLALLGFFGAGLLLAFTPCVLPMVPILSGLIAGQGTRLGTRRALWLSFVYVLANALVFTVAGVIAALLGANLQVAFQTPWVLVLFALLFVALALSSFGVYEIQLPAALRSKLGSASDKQRGGSLAGVAAMGALSALIVGPCVAPPLAAAVLYISQSHDPVFGGLALFILAMGMGAPLLVFGAAAGRGMPTSGPWMTAVQRVFGFIFIGLAIWMLSRVIPGSVTLAMFGVLAVAAAAWAWTGAASANPRIALASRFAGLLLAVVGAAQLFGAFAGGSDPVQPLAGMSGGSHAEASSAAPEATFKIIKSSTDLDREIAAASASGKTVMLDFYADWCVSCKEMERDTFTDAAVRAEMAKLVLLKADVTAADDTDIGLMQRFDILGPPGTLFFVDGKERRALRLVGFEKAAAFAARLQRAGAGK